MGADCGTATCCGSPTVSASVVRKVLLFIFLALRVALIISLIVKGAFDISFFTYVNITYVTLLAPLCIVGLWVPAVMRFYTRWVFPVTFGSTIFVSLAIIVIVQLNDAIYTHDAIPFGGTLTFGWLHTGDWILHQWPAFETLVIFLLIHHYVRVNARTLWACASRGFRAFYIIYVMFSALIPLGVYSIIENWTTRYPIPMNVWLAWLGIVLLVAAIGGMLCLALFCTDDIAYFNREVPAPVPASDCDVKRCDEPVTACAAPLADAGGVVRRGAVSIRATAVSAADLAV